MVTKSYRDTHLEKTVIRQSKAHIRQNQKHLQSLSWLFQVFYISLKIKLKL